MITVQFCVDYWEIVAKDGKEKDYGNTGRIASTVRWNR